MELHDFIHAFRKTEAEIYEKFHRLPHYAIVISGEVEKSIIDWIGSTKEPSCKGILYSDVINKRSIKFKGGIYLLVWLLHLKYSMEDEIADSNGIQTINVSFDPEYRECSIWKVIDL